MQVTSHVRDVVAHRRVCDFLYTLKSRHDAVRKRSKRGAPPQGSIMFESELYESTDDQCTEMLCAYYVCGSRKHRVVVVDPDTGLVYRPQVSVRTPVSSLTSCFAAPFYALDCVSEDGELVFNKIMRIFNVYARLSMTAPSIPNSGQDVNAWVSDKVRRVSLYWSD
jgi:hypothetical protein